MLERHAQAAVQGLGSETVTIHTALGETIELTGQVYREVESRGLGTSQTRRGAVLAIVPDDGTYTPVVGQDHFSVAVSGKFPLRDLEPNGRGLLYLFGE